MTDSEAALDRFRTCARQLDSMVRDFETLPYPRIRDRMSQILQTVDALHREPLHRLMQLVRLHAPDGLADRILEEDTVRGLLMLYDLVPADELSQVEVALDSVRSQLHPYGSDVEVLSVSGGDVHVRLHGGCSDCPASAAALHGIVDSALRESYAAYRSVQVHAAPPREAPAVDEAPRPPSEGG
jgi:Fe-S cluster biogenesis protein NfuA